MILELMLAALAGLLISVAWRGDAGFIVFLVAVIVIVANSGAGNRLWRRR